MVSVARRTLAPAYTLPISWWELIKRTGRETLEDDCLSLAAQLAYYFFLSLFPAVLFLLAVASFFPLQNLTADLTSLLAPFVSVEVLEFIRDQMRRLGNSDSGGILTIGAAGAIWSSSAALVAIVNTLNKAYDVEDSRPWWKVRLLAIGLTSFLAVFVLTSLSLILAGPSVATYLGETVGLGEAFEWTWKIAQWPVAFVLVSTAIGLIYHFGPNVDHNWVWLSPGSLVATALWLVSSLALKFYVQSFADYNATYGAVGAVIVVLIWFYVSGLAILIGAEMDAEVVNARHAAAGLPVPPEARA
jgi:membrane protein